MTDAVTGHLELEVLRLLYDLEEGRGDKDVVDSEDGGEKNILRAGVEVVCDLFDLLGVFRNGDRLQVNFLHLLQLFHEVLRLHSPHAVHVGEDAHQSLAVLVSAVESEDLVVTEYLYQLREGEVTDIFEMLR